MSTVTPKVRLTALPIALSAQLALTLDIPRDLAERLSARAIREGKNLEVVLIEILAAAKPT